MYFFIRNSKIQLKCIEFTKKRTRKCWSMRMRMYECKWIFKQQHKKKCNVIIWQLTLCQTKMLIYLITTLQWLQSTIPYNICSSNETNVFELFISFLYLNLIWCTLVRCLFFFITNRFCCTRSQNCINGFLIFFSLLQFMWHFVYISYQFNTHNTTHLSNSINNKLNAMEWLVSTVSYICSCYTASATIVPYFYLYVTIDIVNRNDESKR